MPQSLDDLFTTDAKFADQQTVLQRLMARAALYEPVRKSASNQAAELVRRIRGTSDPSIMETFLAEYGLSSREGVALMCLAEAMLRVPDDETIDALIEDKIAPSDWGRHMRSSASMLVNASTWALLLTGKVLDDSPPGVAGLLRNVIRRLGEPVIRAAVSHAMKEMGHQFVLGETIEEAIEHAAELEARGFTYSYDMLGEAAMTADDAQRYREDYQHAIAAIARADGSVETNPGISIKLSALHPRYEFAQESRVLDELVPVVRALALQAARARIGLNIDAEEQDRLVLSLKVVAAVLEDPELAGWDGFGVVVQAYGKRAGQVIDWLDGLAARLGRRVMVRLVKGAYWDTEMKLAQVEGLPDFTLFTSKAATDTSYLALASRLFECHERIYPQFATHNAHTVAAVLEMAGDRSFEFQRLHGMGERLHDLMMESGGRRCRIYAPVGAHRDLLAYLVRRLLENGANSSFVHQIVDETISPEHIATDPFDALADARAPMQLAAPARLFGSTRVNSSGFDLTDSATVAHIVSTTREPVPDAGPITVRPATGPAETVFSPATLEAVANLQLADEATVARAVEDAAPWEAAAEARAAVLRQAADLYEQHFGPLFAALTREAGKTLPDAVGELREAVDFLRYYANEALRLERPPLGRIAAISPWNFPLAIFTGQVAAALATGNAVLAKPAEQTPLVAAQAVRLLHEAGVPRTALQLLPGAGETVGAALTVSPGVDGVVFTGSTQTAKLIQRNLAEHLAPGAPLIAETGGLNAMIVDSTALPEQAVRDIVASAFQSAGQRCSALRCLYVQEDIADGLLEMLVGAMKELSVGDPTQLSTDVGPVIDAEAKASIDRYIEAAGERVLYRAEAPADGYFVGPVLIRVAGIEDLTHEVFGPVLHVATFAAEDSEAVLDAINRTGYGLTFGLHTRIDGRVQEITDRIEAGNIYVNRNQIGAVVGSQPFGGEGLSGTGPKAGGALYLRRMTTLPPKPDVGPPMTDADWETACDIPALNAALARLTAPPVVRQENLPGPTGESNRLTTFARGPFLCLGPGRAVAAEQVRLVESLGGQAVAADGHLSPAELDRLEGFAGVIYWGENARAHALALAQRPGPILPLVTAQPDVSIVLQQRHLCVDTTAAGGNAALLSG